MAEFSREDAPPRNPGYPQGASESPKMFDQAGRIEDPGRPKAIFSAKTSAMPGGSAPDRLLPEHSAGTNPRLNRSAEVVGRSVGTVVSTATNVPRQIRNVKSRLRLVAVRSRENVTAAAVEWIDEAADQANRQLDQLRDSAVRGAQAARRNAQWRVVEAKRRFLYWQQEYPLETLAAIAGAVFVVGVGLRVWRSNREYYGE